MGILNTGNLLASPEHIFAGDYAILDANIFDKKINDNIVESSVNGLKQGIGSALISSIKQAVSSVYYILRNICAIAYLCLLIYAGIRIVLASNSPQEQGKWKMYLIDWLKGLALIIFIHVLMIAVFYIADLIKAALNQSLTQGSSIAALCAHNCFSLGDSVSEKLTSLIMFGYITYMTVVFCFAYFKRLIWTTMLIIISPVVAVVYPINSTTYNGKAIFGKWLREFIMNAMLPIFHCIIYYILTILPIKIASSSDNNVADVSILNLNVSVTASNPFILLYCLFSMSMIRPAEKFFRKLFDIHGEVADQGTYESGQRMMRQIEDVIKKIALAIGIAATGGAAGIAAAGAAGGGAAAGGATAGATAGGTAAAGETAAAGTLGEASPLGGMLDAYDEKFASDGMDALDEWDPLERDQMAREVGTSGSYYDNYDYDEMRRTAIEDWGMDEDSADKWLNDNGFEKESIEQGNNKSNNSGNNTGSENRNNDDALVALVSDIKAILQNGNVGEGVQGDSEDNTIKLQEDEELSEESLNELGTNLENQNDKRTLWDNVVNKLTTLRDEKNKNEKLTDAISDVIDSFHGITDEMYTDPAPHAWKNDTWHRGQKDREEERELKLQQYVNNAYNQKVIMDTHNLLEKYRKFNTRSNGTVNEAMAEKQAKEEAKNILQSHKPFLQYGLDNVKVIDKLENYRKDENLTPKQAIKSFEAGMKNDRDLTSGIKQYMIQNHEQVQMNVNGKQQNVDLSKSNIDNFDKAQTKALNEAIEEIKKSTKVYESAGNSQQRSIELAALERNMNQKEILKNLSKGMVKSDYVEKTYNAIGQLKDSNKTVKLNGSDNSKNIKNLEELINSEIGKKNS